MSTDRTWIDLGSATELSAKPLSLVETEGVKICVSYVDGVFGAVTDTCMHRGGPLHQGRVVENCVECHRDPRVEPEKGGGRERSRREKD